MALLECRQLSLNPGGKMLLEGLDWKIDRGDSWGILGPNGCGKSTLLKTLSAQLKVRSGEILIKDQSIDLMKRRQLARDIGLLPQETPYRFPVKVKDIVLAGRFAWQPLLGDYGSEERDLAQAAMETIGIADIAERSADTLSGGEARRVAMALLLCQSPAIALLDEPENHLDPGIRFSMLKKLHSRFTNEEHAMVMVLHDPTAAMRLCSHLIMMAGDGSFTIGPVESIASEEAFSELYGHRMRRYDSTEGPIYYPE